MRRMCVPVPVRVGRSMAIWVVGSEGTKGIEGDDGGDLDSSDEVAVGSAS